MKGAELDGLVFAHPFIERQSPIILADYVTLEQGTGCVHTAPGHGPDDFEIGVKYGLPIINPVDHAGKFTAEGGAVEECSFMMRMFRLSGNLQGVDCCLAKVKETSVCSLLAM